MKLFELVFMEPARLFLASLEPNVRAKVIYTMEHAQYTMDANRFKKLTSELLEFRTLYARKHIRILAFWDQKTKRQRLVVATNGCVKKQKKLDQAMMNQANMLKMRYYEQ
jgi:phage-related protein